MIVVEIYQSSMVSLYDITRAGNIDYENQNDGYDNAEYRQDSRSQEEEAQPIISHGLDTLNQVTTVCVEKHQTHTTETKSKKEREGSLFDRS